MLNTEKKNCALRDKKNILTLVLSKTKNHNPPPPFKLNGRSLRSIYGRSSIGNAHFVLIH